MIAASLRFAAFEPVALVALRQDVAAAVDLCRRAGWSDVRISVRVSLSARRVLMGPAPGVPPRACDLPIIEAPTGPEAALHRQDPLARVVIRLAPEKPMVRGMTVAEALARLPLSGAAHVDRDGWRD